MDGGNGQCLTRIWWRIYGGIEEGTDGRIGRKRKKKLCGKQELNIGGILKKGWDVEE